MICPSNQRERTVKARFGILALAKLGAQEVSRAEIQHLNECGLEAAGQRQ